MTDEITVVWKGPTNTTYVPGLPGEYRYGIPATVPRDIGGQLLKINGFHGTAKPITKKEKVEPSPIMKEGDE